MRGGASDRPEGLTPGVPPDGIYWGNVFHKRFHPTVHAFEYPVYLTFLDVEKAPTSLGALWPVAGYNTAALASFYRSDHVRSEPEERSVDEGIRDIVQRKCGWRPDGPIKVLTHMRYLGYCLNPVSWYYCYHKAPEDEAYHVAAVVAEVTNTPWNEMHHYVCHPGNPETTDLSVPRITVGLTGKALQDASTVNAAAEDRAAARSAGDVPSRLVQAPAQPQRKVRCRFDKTFHVSPFMDMDQQYDWTLYEPGEQCIVYNTNTKGGKPQLFASFRGSYSPLTAWNLFKAIVAMPCAALIVHFWILWNAVLLWCKGVPLFQHPAGSESAESRFIGALATPFMVVADWLKGSAAPEPPHRTDDGAGSVPSAEAAGDSHEKRGSAHGLRQRAVAQ